VRPSSWKSLAGGFVLGGLASLLLGVLVIAPLLLTHRGTWPLEDQVADYALSMASRLHAGSMKNPNSITDRRTLERGQNAFTGSCAQCHGAAGDGKNAILGQTLFPPATDLTSDDVKEKSDAELFWIVQKGLSFTAMPGFGNQYNDDAIWAIVTYMRALQNPGQANIRRLTVPTPTDTELARANPHGDQAARGASVYFAQNCQQCHGGSGNGPGDLNIQRIATMPNDAFITCMIRNGPNGMPAHPDTLISDADLTDLIAFLHTLPAPPPRQGGGPGGTPGGPGNPGARPPGAPPAGAQQGGGPGGDENLFSSAPGADTSACVPPGFPAGAR
jgi:mono/diheme cytochrome c family protein